MTVEEKTLTEKKKRKKWRKSKFFRHITRNVCFLFFIFIHMGSVLDGDSVDIWSGECLIVWLIMILYWIEGECDCMIILVLLMLLVVVYKWYWL